MGNRFLRGIDSILFGSFFTLYRANGLIQQKMDACDIEQFEEDDRLKHSKQELNDMLFLSIDRLQRVENKAMGTLFGIAVAITIFGTTSGMFGTDGLLAEQSQAIKIIAALGIVLAMVYLFGSGFFALGAYKIGSIYSPTLFDKAPVVESNMEAKVIIYSIEQNQRATMLRSNKLSASFSCLRNGLLLVITLGILAISTVTFTADEGDCSSRAQSGQQTTLSILLIIIG